jgi:hypothetical protein
MFASLIVAICVWQRPVLADSSSTNDAHASNGHSKGDTSRLVSQVRDATRLFHDVAMAESAGYAAFLGCVSGPQEGAMGIHYVDGNLVGDGLLDASRPEALIYAPQKDGKLRFVAVEYLVIAADWDATHDAPPVLSGQVFHYSGSPNRYRLPPFYALHVWAWRFNPNGTFVDWNPNVSCKYFAPDAA